MISVDKDKRKIIINDNLIDLSILIGVLCDVDGIEKVKKVFKNCF